MYKNIQIFISKILTTKVSFLLSFIILLPPFLINDITVGLDPSWKIGLGMANVNGLIFGKDLVFTYGPLHFLITKVGVLYKYKWLIFIFEILVVSSLLLIIWNAIKREPHPLRGLFLVMFCGLISDVSCEYYLVLIFLYSIYKSIIVYDTRYLLLLLMISVLTFFIKINFGFVNFLIMLAVYVYVGFRNFKNIPKVLLLTIIYFVSVFLFSKFLNVDVVNYLRTGLQIIDSYNDAMILPFEFGDLVDWVGLLCLLTFCYLLFTNIRFFIETKNLLMTLVVCFYFYLFFKNGFVRIDNHIYAFIFNILLFYLLFYSWNIKLKHLKHCLLVTMLLGLISIPIGFLNAGFFNKNSEFRIKHFKEKIVFWKYPIEVFSSLDYKKTIKENNMSYTKLSLRQLELISNKSVDVLPIDISSIYRYNLNYNPRPVFQSYAAYNTFLDSLNYKKYTGPTAPDFLVVSNSTIDNRVPFWDESITKRAIGTHYDLVETNEKLNRDSSWLLFRKKLFPSKPKFINISNFNAEINQSINIPDDSQPIYLFADVSYSFWGKFRRLVFQAPILKIEFTYSNKNTETYKCVNTILKTGVLINKIVATNEDQYNFYKMNDSKLRKITKIKIIGDAGFESSIKCRFTKFLNSRSSE